jgi:hypothetical protein
MRIDQETSHTKMLAMKRIAAAAKKPGKALLRVEKASVAKPNTESSAKKASKRIKAFFICLCILKSLQLLLGVTLINSSL